MNRFIPLLLFLLSQASANILQDAIDSAPSGATIKLPAGNYIGSVVINRPIIIIGKAEDVRIDGENSGRVITINSPDVILKNLIIANSARKSAIIPTESATTADSAIKYCTPDLSSMNTS